MSLSDRDDRTLHRRCCPSPLDRRAIVLLGVLQGVSVGFDARGEGQAAPADQSSKPTVPLVILLTPTSGSDADDLVAAGARLKEMDVQAHRETPRNDSFEALSSAARAQPAERCLAVFWIAPWRGARALFVHETHTRRTLVRSLSRRAQRATDREELSIIVSATVRALLERDANEPLELEDVEAIEASTATASSAPARETSEPASEPPSTATDRASTPFDRSALDAPLPGREIGSELEVRAGYRGNTRLLSETAAWQNGLGLGLGYRTHQGLELALEWRWMSETRLELGEQVATLSHQRGLLAAGYGLRQPWSWARWAALQGTLGGDWLSRRTDQVPVGSVATQDEMRLGWALGARLGAGFALGRQVTGYTFVGVELPISEFEYVAAGAGDELRSGTLRPRLTIDLGAGMHLL